MYNKIILRNFKVSISYLTKALNILNKLGDEEANCFLKFNLFTRISGTCILGGEIKLSEEFSKKAEKLLTRGIIQKVDLYLIYSLKSTLFYIQGKYKEALECEDKIMELFIKNGSHINDLYFTATYLYRAKILNFLGRYQKSYDQAQQLYNTHKKLIGYDYDIKFSCIYTEKWQKVN